jgi:hypothetical protein
MKALEMRTLVLALAALVAATTMCLAGPWASLAHAQDDTGNEDQTSQDCPGAQEVATLSGDGDRQSSPFDVSGDSVRASVNTEATSQDPSLSFVSVSLVDAESSDTVGSADFEGGGEDSSILNVGPGRFFLDVVAANADYEVLVEDCTGTPGADDGGAGDGSSSGAGGDGSEADDGDQIAANNCEQILNNAGDINQNQDDDNVSGDDNNVSGDDGNSNNANVTAEQVQECKNQLDDDPTITEDEAREDVVDGVDDETELANTGGPPILTIGGILILCVVGLAVVGLGIVGRRNS